MSDVNANIHIGIDTGQAQAELRRLQAQITAFNTSMSTMDRSAGSMLASGINATKMFNAQMIPVVDSVTRFSQALEGNKLSLGQYARTAASQLPGLGRVFRSEFDMMERVATDRVKKIQTQYIALGKTAKGVQEALAITPTGLARGHATDMAVAAQKQQIFNKLIDDGSTKMLNWGKNTQWAGRQLMVGFSIPLAALGTVAAKTFMELDKATTAFERVYGDLSTATSEMEANKAAVQTLGKEYTKYGIALKDTIDLSARVAATGATNEDLLAGTEQTLRFATLGQMDYNEALDATISLQSAFNVSSKDLGSTIDYLNAVENQTVLTIQDMAAAIPRVAPVIQGLGGDVKDLAVMMTAMREGGVSAENAANALKSGLASLINPTDRAKESMAKLGINMDAIINANRGDLLATVKAFGDALSVVDEFSQQQALEQIFGKYQYARMGALFSNIADGASQASRAMDLAGMSISELAQLSEKELGTIEESTTVKFQAALENLKISIAPLGEAFLKGLMPIMDVVTKIADAFNSLPDPIKNIIAVITGLVAGIGPVLLMTFGLIGNGIANIVKGIQWFRKRLAGIKGDASAFTYFAEAELQAKGASDALEASVTSLTGNLILQRGAVNALIKEYGRYVTAAGIAAKAGGPRGNIPRVKMASGGVVPGSGNKDTVPALLTPGETVITKEASQRYGPVIAAMNAGTLPGYQYGLDEGITGATYGPRTSGSAGLARMDQTLQRYLDTLDNGQEIQEDINRRLQEQSRVKPLTVPDIKNIVREATGQEGMFSPRREGRASMGAPLWVRNKTAEFKESGMFSAEEAFIRSRMGGRASDDMFKIDASHIEKQLDEFGNKVWNASNLFPDFSGVNKTLNDRMKSFDAAIQKGTVSISDAAAMMRQRTPDLIEGLSSEEIEFELDRLRQGIHPVTENATRVATSFAELDAALSREALELGVERTALGTRSATGRNAEFFAAAGQYRLGEGREEYFGSGRRSEQRYEEQGRRSTQAFVRGARSAAGNGENDPWELVTPLRNSPHPEAGPSGKQDAQAYIAAQRAELAKLRQSSGMSAKEQYKRTQSETRALDRVSREMGKAGYTQAQIERAQKRILAGKLREAKAVEAAANAAQKNAVTESQITAAKTKTLAEERRRSSLASKAGKAGMTLGMASMLPFMAQNEQGQFMGMDANALGMGMMGTGMALDMVGMMEFDRMAGIAAKAAGALGMTVPALGLALGGVTLAATAAGVGLYLWRKSVDDSARAAAELGANLGGAANAANNMAAMLGKQTPAQREAARLAGMTVDEQAQAASEFQYIFESDAGKAFIAELESATSEERFSKLGDYLKTAIATGMMDQKQAELFGKSLALQIGDGVLAARIGTAIKDQLSGVEGMLDLANKRASAINSSSAMAAVQAGTAGTQQSSTVIGGALQSIQDFANVAAIAKDQYANGQISYEEMRAALDAATAAQNQYTEAIRYALSQGDIGGNMQAITQAIVDAGIMTQDEVDTAVGELEATTTKREGPPGKWGLGANVALNPQDTQELIALWASLLFEGMPKEMAKDTAQSVFGTKESREEYLQVSGQIGQTDAAKVIASDIGMIDTDALAQNTRERMANDGVTDAGTVNAEVDRVVAEAEAKNIVLRNIKIDYIRAGGELEEFDAYLARFSEEKGDIELRAKFEALSPTNQKRVTDDLAAMQSKITDETAKKVQAASDYSMQDADAINKASEVFKGEDLDKIINVILETEPPNLDEVLPQLTEYATELNDRIPADIQKLIGIDITNKEDLELYGPMAEELGMLVPAIDALPEGMKELGVSMIFTDGKKPKDPITFANDVNKAMKTIKKLSSDKIKVRKVAAIELLTQITGPSGEEITIDQASSVFQNIVKASGLSQKKFLQLPTDTIQKIYALAVQVDPAYLGMSIKQLKGIIAYNELFGYDSSIEKAAIEILRQMRGAAGAGIIEGGNELPSGGGGGGGGGGGESSNPLKDLNKTLLDQIKMFANVSATMKKLNSAKYGFFDILRMGNGIDDKILKAGFSPALTEYLMGLDPKDALKLLKKFTDKSGKLNELGRRRSRQMEAASLSESISGRMSEARSSIEGTRYQNIALSSLMGRGAPTEMFEQIAADPQIAKEYVNLREAARKAREEFVAFREKAKEGEYTDKEKEKVAKLREEWQKAKNNLKEYIDLLVKQQRQSEAAATAYQMRIDERQARETTSIVGDARTYGFDSPEMLEALSSGEYNSYIQEAETARDTLADLLANPVEEGEKGWKKYQKQVEAAQNAVNTYGATAEETLQNVQDHIANQKWIEYVVDPLGYLADQAQDTFDNISTMFDQEFLKLEDQSNMDFAAQYGMSKEDAEEIIENNEVILAGFKAQRQELENAISTENILIKALERGKKAWQDKIDAAQKEIDGWQRSIDLYNRQVDLRNHDIDLLNHDLDIMSQAEEKINEAYDKRIEALDEVVALNDHLIAQQQNQLNLAQALTTGDVYAAAQAQAAMQAEQVQYASDQARAGLEQGRENALGGLRTAQGLTRDQVEERVRVLQEQNYQTGLLIYDLEEKIYGKNEEIYGYKLEIDKIQTSIEGHTNKIWDYEGQILEIEKQTEPLQAQNDLWKTRLDYSSQALEDKKSDAILYGMTLKQHEMLNRRYQTQLKAQKASNALANDQLAIWKKIGLAIGAAQTAMTGDLSLLNKGDFEGLAERYGDAAIAQFFNAETESYDLEGLKKFIIDMGNQTMTDLLNQGINSMVPVAPEGTNLTDMPDVGAGGTSLPIISIKKTRWEGGMAVDQDGNPINGWILNDTGKTIDKDGTDWINGMLWQYQNGKPGAGWRMMAAGGHVFGAGSRDSVPSMLSPGEFIMRRAAVQKYGLSTFEKMNMGSFSMPRYSVPQTVQPTVAPSTSVANISAPVYNTYSVTVPVTQPNASADEIANKVITRIRNLEDRSIRRINGY